LPEQAVGQLAFIFPDAIVRDEIIQQVHDEFPVVIHEVAIPGGGGQPTAEFV
jgi:hypothetical protein